MSDDRLLPPMAFERFTISDDPRGVALIESTRFVIVERWQEYDCPDSGIDFDLNDEQMVFEGDSFYCSGCGSHHVATPELVQQYETTSADDLPRVVPLQRRATP